MNPCTDAPSHQMPYKQEQLRFFVGAAWAVSVLTFISKSLGQLVLLKECVRWLMPLMCCCGRILHPISADLLLQCGALIAAVGGRWLALISFVSLIMCLSQRLSDNACLNPCTALLSRVSLAPLVLPGKERVVINMQRGEECLTAGVQSRAWIIIKRWHSAGSH